MISWSEALQQKRFKIKAFIGLVLLAITLFMLPHFFGMIEKREGLVLNDWLLNRLPAINVSIPVFTIIWGMVVLTLYECYKKPNIFIQLLWAFLFLTFSRVLSIFLVPLNPPENLVTLADPLSNYFYGEDFITKDLFFSGHTSTQFLLFFVLKEKWQKTLALFASIAIGTLVLFQHVHYTIDVIGAFLFTPFIYKASLWVSGKFKDK